MADDGTDELDEMRQRYITLLKKALRNSLYSNDKHPTKADLGLELPGSRGHLILGETLEEGGPDGSSSEVPRRVPS